MTPGEASKYITEATPVALQGINDFSREVLRTRGGRVGSGMGTLLEALWGYHVNLRFQDPAMALPIEVAWLIGHEYNDFACVRRCGDWDPETRVGEFLRIEAKSMNVDTEEPKGHFDEIVHNLGDSDLLVVLLWAWESLEDDRVYPRVVDHFIGSALRIAGLRDRLHLARGGTFVDRGTCPDGCVLQACTHHGEPLNAKGQRERVSGPVSRRSEESRSASNFGGLVRMLKTRDESARREFGRLRFEDDVAHEFISFIHHNFESEESNQYLLDEWRTMATESGLEWRRRSKEDLIAHIRQSAPNYGETLRTIRGWLYSP